MRSYQYCRRAPLRFQRTANLFQFFIATPIFHRDPAANLECQITPILWLQIHFSRKSFYSTEVKAVTPEPSFQMSKNTNYVAMLQHFFKKS